MLTRLGLLVIILAVLELALFDWRYSDHVFLSRPPAVLARVATGDFRKHAERALARPSLTRATLETIAQTAATRDDDMILFPALRRLASEYPHDSSVLLRLADNLRKAGLVEEAGQFYRRAIEETKPTQPTLFPDY